MIADLHNLLPRDTKRTLRMRYYMRVVTVVGFLLSGCLVAGMVALIPVYVVLSSTQHTLDTELNHLRTALEEEGLDADSIKNMQELLQELAAYEVSDVQAQLNTVTGARESGIALVGYVFDVPNRKVAIEGTAESRDNLVSFVNTLEQEPLIEKVTLPISNLATRNDVAFEMALMLASSSRSMTL